MVFSPAGRHALLSETVRIPIRSHLQGSCPGTSDMACSLHSTLTMHRLPTPVRTVALLVAATLLTAGAAAAQPAASLDASASAGGERSGQENSFGVEVASKGLWKEAAYRWEKAVELDPQNPKAHNNLGVAYERSGKFEEALEAYETALELMPSNEQIRQNYELFREAYERKKRKDRDAARSRRR